MTIKDLKKGEYFTIKEIEEPTDSQIWVRNHYDRATKTYSASNYADINRERFFKASKQVFPL